MSTFSGFLDGIKYVSVDRFTELNLQSKVFFLSHCHMDHMIGLNEITSEMELPGPLYLSEVSKVIVRRKYPAIKNMISLNLGEATPITISNVPNETGECSDKKLSVTAVPAGHCPGSIMLLFEQGDKRVLYTGDFRLYREDIEGMIALKKFHDKITLDSLHVDSSFLTSDYVYFPKQRESINTIIELADDWLQMHPRNIIVLRPPAAYGYEFLLMEMSKHFRAKIHVSGVTFKDYVYIPEFDSYISNNRLHCGRIHLCASNPMKWQHKQCPCLPDLHDKHICIIRPTAMKWKRLSPTHQHYEKHRDMPNVYCVCYSNHSSCDEIKFLVNYLHPKTVRLNVVPKNSEKRHEMHDIVQALTKEYQHIPTEENAEPDISQTVEFNFQEILSSSRKRSMALAPDEISQLRFKKRPKN